MPKTTDPEQPPTNPAAPPAPPAPDDPITDAEAAAVQEILEGQGYRNFRVNPNRAEVTADNDRLQHTVIPAKSVRNLLAGS